MKKTILTLALAAGLTGLNAQEKEEPKKPHGEREEPRREPGQPHPEVPRPKPPGEADIERRVDALRQAADKLQEAGLGPQAQELRMQAEAIAREIRARREMEEQLHRQKDGAGEPPHHPAAPNEIAALRREVAELREIVQRLMMRLEDRKGPPAHEGAPRPKPEPERENR